VELGNLLFCVTTREISSKTHLLFLLRFFLEPVEVIVSSSDLIIIYLFVSIERAIFVSFTVGFGVSNNIDIGPVDVFERSHVRVSSNALGSVDTDNFAAITRFDIVDEVLICTHVNGLWSLSFWDSLRCFLHLDMLFIREHAPIVNHLESASTSAIITEIRLGNLTSFDKFEFLLLTFGALEIGFFHLWDCVGGSDNNTLESDKLVDLARVKFTDLEDLSHIEGSNLNNLVVLLHIILSHAVKAITLVAHLFDILVVDLGSYQIENWNDISGIVFQLFIQLLVKSVHMVAIYVQCVVLGVIDFSKLLDVEWNRVWHFTISVHINIFVISGNEKGCEEFSELGLNVGGIDIGTP